MKALKLAVLTPLVVLILAILVGRFVVFPASHSAHADGVVGGSIIINNLLTDSKILSIGVSIAGNTSPTPPCYNTPIGGNVTLNLLGAASGTEVKIFQYPVFDCPFNNALAYTVSLTVPPVGEAHNYLLPLPDPQVIVVPVVGGSIILVSPFIGSTIRSVNVGLPEQGSQSTCYNTPPGSSVPLDLKGALSGARVGIFQYLGADCPNNNFLSYSVSLPVPRAGATLTYPLPLPPS
jgi:hypothetical protein